MRRAYIAAAVAAGILYKAAISAFAGIDDLVVNIRQNPRGPGREVYVTSSITNKFYHFLRTYSPLETSVNWEDFIIKKSMNGGPLYALDTNDVPRAFYKVEQSDSGVPITNSVKTLSKVVEE